MPSPVTPSPVTPSPAVELLRREHDLLAKEMQQRVEEVGELSGASAERAEAIQRAFVRWLERVIEHDDWEERVLFPAVDKYTVSGGHAFTATLRHEHQITARWLRELRRMIRDGAAPTAVARRADQIMGLLMAHLDTETAVLVHVLETVTSDHVFQRDILARMSAPPEPEDD